MKKVKLMLSGIFVVAIAASALAFKASRIPNICAYAATSNTTATTIGNCPFVTLSATTTVLGAPNQYATAFPRPATGCPPVSVCLKSRTLTIEQ